MRRSFPPAVLAVACLALPAAAADKKPELAKARFGSPLAGPMVDLSALKGHAVVIEFWGAN